MTCQVIFISYIFWKYIHDHSTEPEGRYEPSLFQPFGDGLTKNQFSVLVSIMSESLLEVQQILPSAPSCDSIWPLLGINKALNKLICIVCYKPEIFKRLCYLNSTAESQFIIYLKKQKPYCRKVCFVSGFHKKRFLLL